jgi:hypothetical protein
MFFRSQWSAAEVAKLVAGLRAAQIRDVAQLKSELIVLAAVAVVVIVMVVAMMMGILMVSNRLTCGGFVSVKNKKDDLLFHLAEAW